MISLKSRERRGSSPKLACKSPLGLATSFTFSAGALELSAGSLVLVLATKSEKQNGRGLLVPEACGSRKNLQSRFYGTTPRPSRSLRSSRANRSKPCPDSCLSLIEPMRNNESNHTLSQKLKN